VGASLPPEGKRFRPDVEGLRAIAVAIVLLYHADIPGFSGGFVGVDVFFVLSGFLITGLLMQELEATGRIHLARFYARRVRRLLPASALVALFTFVVGRFVLPPLQVADLRGDAVATATYLANVRFAQTGTDYLAAEGVSPYQHYWSLALEEQFYLAWPVILLVAYLVGRRSSFITPRRAVIWVVCVLVASSLALSVALTATRQPWAFFLLPTRAWELGAGGMLALAMQRHTPRDSTARLLVIAGLATIALSTFLFGRVADFPGWIAMIPVLGTVLCLAGGETRGIGVRILSLEPLQRVGKRSYSIYLWHWPLLVLAGAEAGRGAPVIERVALLALALALAWLTFALLEDPIRQHRALAARPAVSFGLATAITATSIAAAFASTTMPNIETGVDVPDSTDIAFQDVDSLSTPVLPDNLLPALMAARSSNARVYTDGCHIDQTATELPQHCVYGDPEASRILVLFGDSHAANWFPALERIAREDGWRLLSRTKSACPPYGVPRIQHGVDYVACDVWREKVLDEIRSLEPNLVMTAAERRDEEGHEFLTGMSRTVRSIAPSPTLVLSTAPKIGRDVPACVSLHRFDIGRCSPPRPTAYPAARWQEEREVVEAAGGDIVDLGDILCGDERCPTVVGNLLMYRDSSHLTEEYSEALAPVVRTWIGSHATGGAPDSPAVHRTADHDPMVTRRAPG
jgi:peptidoglycan/LPS O-acetylase OafA/YrhL